MYETIILAVCLTRTPSLCKEVDISVEPDPTGSLQLPFHCTRRGQMEAQKWIAENPTWHVERWSCHPYGKARPWRYKQQAYCCSREFSREFCL